MSNLILTEKCNLNCKYCFNKMTQLKDNGDSGGFMTFEVFNDVLNYLTDSGVSEVRMLGGEPSLHPFFMEMIQTSLDRGFNVLLFSNGLMSDKTTMLLKEFDPDRLSILVNVVDHTVRNDALVEWQARTMDVLGNKVFPGVTIYHLNHKFDHFIDLISKHDLKPKIRTGIAHPHLTRNNSFLNPKHYPLIGEQLELFWYQAKEHGITLEFDCGFVPCMFSEKFLQEEMSHRESVFARCGPIIDINTDGSVISCFPLSSFETIESVHGRRAGEIADHFHLRLTPYKEFGIYPYCSKCELFTNGICAGGCRAAAMLRMRNVELNSPFQLKRNF